MRNIKVGLKISKSEASPKRNKFIQLLDSVASVIILCVIFLAGCFLGFLGFVRDLVKGSFSTVNEKAFLAILAAIIAAIAGLSPQLTIIVCFIVFLLA